MPTHTTRECAAVGQPELVLRFSDARDTAQVVRWAESIVLEVWDGRRLESGDRLRFFGWPVELVASQEGFEVHEDDLGGPHDAPRFVPGVDRAARYTRMQRELAESHGLSYEPVDARLATFQICADVAHELRGAKVLARSRPADAEVNVGLEAAAFERIAGRFASGWRIACSRGDECTGRGPHGSWSTVVTLGTLLAGKPDLVPFLGLPAGSVVELPLDASAAARIGTLPADSRLEPEWNPLVLAIVEGDPTRWQTNRFARLLGLVHAELRGGAPAADPAFFTVPLVLDPAVDPELGGVLVVEQIMKRHGVNEASAKAALHDVMTSGRWEAWLVAHHHAHFPDGLYATVRDALDGDVTPRWRLQNDIARRLHEQTGIAFALWKRQVEALDLELRRLRSLAATLAKC